MPTLKTDRLTLRPYEENDLPEYFKLLSDRENLYFLNDIVTDTLDQAKQSLTEAIQLMGLGKARRFGITLAGHSTIIGAVGYDITATTPLGRIGHMGWFIMPEHQRNGYVAEAAARLLEYAFTEDDCIRIETGCYAENIPTQKVMEKVGFVLEARKFLSQYHDGKMKDRLNYAINKEDWEVSQEIIHYRSLPCVFDGFIDVPTLSDGEVYLVCVRKDKGNPEKKYVPGYNFLIGVNGEKVGEIGLRIGYGGGPYNNNLYYGGQIGYGIDEPYRGNSYASRACKLLIPIAKAHQMNTLLITNDIINRASMRVCEKLGAKFVRVARLPEWHELYKNGQRFTNVYEWVIG